MHATANHTQKTDITNLSLKELRHVALLSQTLNFGRAAELAGISQSALSQSIAKIERGLGLQLFERNRRSVSATAVARLVAEHADQVAHTMKSLQIHTEALLDSRTGYLTFGIGIFAANHLLTPIMLKTHERFPHTQIQVVVGPPSELREKLRAGEIEFFVAADDPQYHDDNTVRESLYTDELVIVCRAGHPLNQTSPLTYLDIINYPAITYDGSYLKRQLYPLLSSAYEFELLSRNYPAIALQQPWSMAEFVKVSDHIILSTLSPLQDALHNKDLVALTLSDLNLTIDMHLVQRNDAIRSPLHDGVVGVIKDVLANQALAPGIGPTL